MRRAFDLVVAAAVVGIVALLVGTSCAPGRPSPRVESGTAPEASRVGLGDDAAAGAFGFVDGATVQSFRARVTADREQTVVRTGFAAGADQGKVLVLDDDGTRALDWAIPFRTPFPRPAALGAGSGAEVRQAMVAGGDQVVPFTAAGRRFLLVGTNGRHEASAFVLLEFGGDGRAQERVVFWNEGSIRHVFVSETHVGFYGVHNALDRASIRTDLGERYAAVLAVFRIPPAGGDGAVQTGRSPRGEAPGFDAGGGYDAYFRLPFRQTPRTEVSRMPAVADGRVVLVDGAGATETVDLATYDLSVSGGSGGSGVSADAPPLRAWR